MAYKIMHYSFPDKVIAYVQTSDGLPVYTADNRPVAVLI